jgi:iron complex transport system substrate-binding protein
MKIWNVPGMLALASLFYAMAGFSALKTVDDSGQEVVLSAAVKKVVSLAPHLTEVLFDLGVQDTLVGTSRYSDYPQAARHIDIIADAFQINVEAVIARQPDLILAWSSGGGSRALLKLKQLGFPVYRNEARTLADIGSTFVRLGTLFDKKEKGLALQARFSRALQNIRHQYAGQDLKRVYLQISERQLYSINDQHLIGQALQLCHATNVFGKEAMMVAPVSKESVLVRKPEVLIISSSIRGFSESSRMWSQFQQFRGKIRFVDSGKLSRPSLRMLEGIEDLCAQVHTKEAWIDA